MLNESDLYEYQRRSIEHIMNNEAAGLLLEMGLGKTVSCLTAINRLMYEDFEINATLVVGPKRVIEQSWPAEIQVWEHLKHLRISRVVGNPVQRWCALKERADIYLISKDNLMWLISAFGGNNTPFDMLVIDESSCFKNHKAKKFKALKRVLGSFSRRVILTGTPAPKNLMDLWSQIYILDQGQRLSKFITHFKKRFFNLDTWGGYEKYTSKGKASKEELYDTISDICISMKAKDYLDLPERINIYDRLNFGKSIWRKYGSFKKEMYMELIDETGGDFGAVTAASAAGLMSKLLQFANGAVYDEDKNVLPVHNLKLDAVEDIVEAAQGNPVLIAYSFKHDKDRLLKRLKRFGVKALNHNEDIDLWNRKEIPVMLMHPASGGHGLNLQKGGHRVVWYGLPWSLELYQQFNARLDRQGQKERPIVHHIMMEGSVDEKVLSSLQRKEEGQSALMAAVKADFRKYMKK